jgi:hypothetical protein
LDLYTVSNGQGILVNVRPIVQLFQGKNKQAWLERYNGAIERIIVVILQFSVGICAAHILTDVKIEPVFNMPCESHGDRSCFTLVEFHGFHKGAEGFAQAVIYNLRQVEVCRSKIARRFGGLPVTCVLLQKTNAHQAMHRGFNS